MVSKIRKLAELQALARLRQDVELAKLARLTAEDRRIAAQQSALSRDAASIRASAPRSAAEARLQDRFGTWTDLRLEALAGARATLYPLIDAQKSVAARAVGREDVLGRLAEQLAQAKRREDSRDP